MARKNAIQEIKGFGKATVAKKGQQQVKGGRQQVKSKSQHTPEPIPTVEEWQAWECRTEGDNPTSWHQVWEGDLEECFEMVAENVSCQIEEQLNRDGSLDALLYKYGDDSSNTLHHILQGLHAPRVARIKAQCQRSGGYRGEGWAVTLNTKASKFQLHQSKGIFTYSNTWAGFEQVGQNANDPKSWRAITDGSLDECIEGIGFFINIDIERATEGQLSDDMDIGDFFRYKLKLRSCLIEEIKRVCQIKGYYNGCGFEIQSQLSQEECWWIARHGSLDNYPLSS